MKEKTTCLRNDLGERVSGYPSLRKEVYWSGEYYSNDERRPRPDYEKWLQHADEHGFDLTCANALGNYIEQIKLPKGTHIIRYGADSGRYTAPKGTNFDQLSLPWKRRECEYHEYVVIADSITVACIVTKGFAAPGFECVGGGVQYRHSDTIIQSINLGVLDEVELWK